MRDASEGKLRESSGQRGKLNDTLRFTRDSLRRRIVERTANESRPCVCDTWMATNKRQTTTNKLAASCEPREAADDPRGGATAAGQRSAGMPDRETATGNYN